MKIPLLPVQEVGSLRKPEYLITKWQEYFSGAIDYDELDSSIKKASKASIAFFEKLGLDIVWDGEMHRWEMYHYPMSNIEGVELLGQVRVFGNKYYVKGSIVGRPRLKINYHLNEYLYVSRLSKKPVKIPITGPYTLVEWSYNEYYYRKWAKLEHDPVLIEYNCKRDAVYDVARNIINPILIELSKFNPFRIQIDEPAALTHPSEVGVFVEAFNEAVKGVERLVNIHICYSDYNRLLPYILDLHARQIMLEFSNRDPWVRGVDDDVRRGFHFLKELMEYSYSGEIGLGVVDVHNKRIEPVELIEDRIEYALRFFDANKIYVNPDCGFRTLTRRTASAKLRNMVEAVQNIRRKYTLE